MNEQNTAPRIALIHAVQWAMAPVAAAFVRTWPQARCVNLLDDALPADLLAAGHLSPALFARIAALADQAMAAGAQGVLFTCSAFGPAIEAVAARSTVPVLKPNQAMFDVALRGGAKRIGMLATFAPAAASMKQEFIQAAREAGSSATLETVCVPEALAAAQSGDIAEHNRLLAQAVPRLAHCDAVMLAHFSTASAMAAVRAVLTLPVLCAPDAAVAELKRYFTG